MRASLRSHGKSLRELHSLLVEHLPRGKNAALQRLVVQQDLGAPITGKRRNRGRALKKPFAAGSYVVTILHTPWKVQHWARNWTPADATASIQGS